MLLYYIWSFEHGAFWAPNREGYTPDVRLAGTYREDIAAQIVEQARGNEIAFIADMVKAFSKPRAESPDVIVYDLRLMIALKP